MIRVSRIPLCGRNSEMAIESGDQLGRDRHLAHCTLPPLQGAHRNGPALNLERCGREARRRKRAAGARCVIVRLSPVHLNVHFKTPFCGGAILLWREWWRSKSLQQRADAPELVRGMNSRRQLGVKIEGVPVHLGQPENSFGKAPKLTLPGAALVTSKPAVRSTPMLDASRHAPKFPQTKPQTKLNPRLIELFSLG